VTRDSDDLINQWFGDALVRKESATGKSKGKHHVPFNQRHCKEFTGLVHQRLINSPEVYGQIKKWMSQRATKKSTLIQKPAEQKIPHDISDFLRPVVNNNSKLKGVARLTTEAMKEGINLMEVWNKNRVSYQILKYIPGVNLVSRKIEDIQVSITSRILTEAKAVITKV
jgi:hypothetical protein